MRCALPQVLKITQGVLIRCENFLLYPILQRVTRQSILTVLIKVDAS